MKGKQRISARRSKLYARALARAGSPTPQLVLPPAPAARRPMPPSP